MHWYVFADPCLIFGMFKLFLCTSWRIWFPFRLSLKRPYLWIVRLPILSQYIWYNIGKHRVSVFHPFTATKMDHFSFTVNVLRLWSYRLSNVSSAWVHKQRHRPVFDIHQSIKDRSYFFSLKSHQQFVFLAWLLKICKNLWPFVHICIEKPKRIDHLVDRFGCEFLHINLTC